MKKRCAICKNFIPKIRINDGPVFSSCEFVQDRDDDFDLEELVEMDEGSQGQRGSNYYCEAFEPCVEPDKEV